MIREHKLEQARQVLAAHARMANQMDLVGILTNIALIPGGIFAFVFFTAQRLDGENQVSFFVLLTPIWISALPLSAYLVLNGMAAPNLNLSTCEKLLLSLLVPVGFLICLICLILFVEGKLPVPGDSSGLSSDAQTNRYGLKPTTAGDMLLFAFVPHFVSLLCLYLYLRCLSRPHRVHSTN